MKIRVLLVVLSLVGSFPLAALAANYEGKVLVFASSFQEAKPVANDILSLGSVELSSGNKAKVGRYLYKAKDNLPPHDLAGHVPVMAAPYGKGLCKNRTLQAPTAQGFIAEAAKWRVQGKDGLVLSFAGNDYHWGSDAAAPNALRLLSVTDARGQRFAQAVGYAFLSEQLEHGKALAKSDLAERFGGDLFHKNMLEGAADGWKASQSSLMLREFKEQSQDGDLLEYSKVGIAEAVKRAKGEIWAHNVLLLNNDPNSKLIAYQDYGHDFNRNGCYDEHGHKKILMAIPQAGQKIDQLVYIEYTYDKNDGYPMLSVGRYFNSRKNP